MADKLEPTYAERLEYEERILAAEMDAIRARREAADEITRLNALVDELVEGLEPFARADASSEDIANIRRARALICRVKGIKPATEPSPKVPKVTHG